MNVFLSALPYLLCAALLAVVSVGPVREIRQARREAAARAFARARHPAQLARRPLRRHCPGLPIDGEPLSEDDLATYTQIMMTPPIGSTQARETSAGEETE